MKTLRFALPLLFLAPACGGGDVAADAAVIPDATPDTGTFSLSWTLTDGTDPITCANVGGLSVAISVTPAGGGSGQSEAFSCGSGSGTSRPMRAGIYNLSIELRASAGPLAAAVSVPNVEIKQAADTPLSAVDFTVVAKGGISFTIDTASSGDNCDTSGSGAGITAASIELRDASGACVPATFEVAAGAATSASTYTTTCPATGQHACIENDQAITVTGIDSGTHSLTITGFKDATPCYGRNPQFDVPGNNLSADLPTQQLDLRFVPACDPNAPDAGPPVDAGLLDSNI